MRTVESTDRDATRPAEQGGGEAHDLKRVLGEIERDLILTALRESHGNKAKAARALGITERLMGIRVKRLGIDWRRLRTSRKREAENTAGS
jgi:transcriptional regulator with GAF, ATPase, and Fis domain